MFTPRTTAPVATDPNYISSSRGGNAHAIPITGSCVLPNCVGYVHGRVIEIAGKAVEAVISRGNACTFYDYNDGLGRSASVPVLGAIMVWESKGSNAYGHVAIVEEVYSNGDVLASASNYKGTWWYTSRFTKSSGYRLTSSKSTYSFRGFVYMPSDVEKVGDPVLRDPSKHQVEVIYSALRARKRPELGAEVMGYANMGFYDVLAIKDMTAEPSNGYLWYKIGTNLWIAHVEGCVNDYPAEETDPDELERLRKENAELRTEVISLELTTEKLRATIDEIAALAHYN